MKKGLQGLKDIMQYISVCLSPMYPIFSSFTRCNLERNVRYTNKMHFYFVLLNSYVFHVSRCKQFLRGAMAVIYKSVQHGPKRQKTFVIKCWKDHKTLHKLDWQLYYELKYRTFTSTFGHKIAKNGNPIQGREFGKKDDEYSEEGAKRVKAFCQTSLGF